MSTKTYTLQADEKATQVMVGTSDMLMWGDLVTKEQARVAAFLNTLAEDFVCLRDVKVLFLAPAQQAAPVDRAEVYVKYEEILVFYTMGEALELPEESEVRRLEPIEAVVGSFHISGAILKSPLASLQNLLLVTKEGYIPIYKATIRHVAKPWLGAFTTPLVQLRMDRLAILRPRPQANPTESS